MRKIFQIILILALVHCSILDGQTTTANQPVQGKNLTLEYARALGFSERQILGVEIIDDRIMKVYIDECSLCKVFKNSKEKDDLARRTLNWFLNKTGNKKGTVEWHNSSKMKIMTISGGFSEAKITSGLPCAVR